MSKFKVGDKVWLSSFWGGCGYQIFTGIVVSSRIGLLGRVYIIDHGAHDTGSDVHYRVVTRRYWWRVWQ